MILGLPLEEELLLLERFLLAEYYLVLILELPLEEELLLLERRSLIG